MPPELRSQASREADDEVQLCRDAKILLIGLHGAGKTSVVCALTGERPVASVEGGETALRHDVALEPRDSSSDTASKLRCDRYEAASFKIVTLDLDCLSLHVYDCTGLRETWASLLAGVRGLIYVVDCTDVDELNDTISALSDALILTPGVPCLICANKQDIAGATSADEVHRLVVRDVPCARLSERMWTVIPTVATVGTGVRDGLAWLVKNLAAPAAGDAYVTACRRASTSSDVIQRALPA
eukprot:TRINITY_DN36730_c0_g1_i2.p1 TRINITY_DN36730_c0_g1~~TRINITY_DN36730_c0_g1_i2.p1  ORF type:complete len:242 (+),score=30.27 TRINITY_DN36730_c0_g1_i2:335-1060(+)